MQYRRIERLAAIVVVAFAATASASGTYHEVAYPPSTEPDELRFGVTYTLWIPDDVKTLRAVIVHQHGCGDGACRGGATAAYDLHWQALAAKWDCALLGPSYQQGENPDCRLWCDPRNGSEGAFLKALDDLAGKSGHSELKSVPWCLWGHSGGGFWSSLMQVMHPERIVAVWNRSGTAFSAWESGEIPKPEIAEAAYGVPVMCNPGVQEKGDARFGRAWDGCLAMVEAYRAHGAPIGFAPDPRTSHQCGDSRYLAIPFFDACLAMRLPEAGSTSGELRPVDWNKAWYAEPLGREPSPADSYRGDKSAAAWLPDGRVAEAWTEYVATGAVGDTSPPAAPVRVKAVRQEDNSVRITWDATADLESGLAQFMIERDGKPIARVPDRPVGRFGRPLFQAMSYHDTPEPPLPEMAYVDLSAEKGTMPVYRVIATNSVGLESEPSQPAE
ncbi:MAG: alpha/beta hydrolase [Thermoguttaceae bacterium]